jgi:hypothetical protein
MGDLSFEKLVYFFERPALFEIQKMVYFHRWSLISETSIFSQATCPFWNSKTSPPFTGDLPFLKFQNWSIFIGDLPFQKLKNRYIFIGDLPFFKKWSIFMSNLPIFRSWSIFTGDLPFQFSRATFPFWN